MAECCADVRGIECHCARCHQTFRGLSQFDRHQDVDYARPRPVECRAPASLGLTQDSRGTWCTPEGLKDAERLRGTLARARFGRTDGSA